MSLKIKNLKKQFRQGDTTIEVLKDINAEIKNGEVVAILGQSGSGKSTLLSLMAGLDRSSSGSIEIDSHIFESMDEVQMTQFRGRNIGIVFQQFHLLQHLTALENVMLPLEILDSNGSGKKSIEERAKEILVQMNLGHRLDHFPRQLSGGECQRVAIARALVVEPKILLADEPSGNLDSETGQQVMDAFFKIIKTHKVTTILVTHSSSLAQMCDRQLVLQRGVFQ
jgi:putative ABC transport system ATP-binding protein